MSSGVAVNESCLEIYQELKLRKKYKFLLFKLSDDHKEIVLEKAIEQGEYSTFLEHLPKDEPRYAVYDFEYEKPGEGTRNKIVFYACAFLKQWDENRGLAIHAICWIEVAHLRGIGREGLQEATEPASCWDCGLVVIVLHIRSLERCELTKYSPSTSVYICTPLRTPDTAKIRQKMVYASSKDALRKTLVGISTEIQGTDFDEVEYDTILEKVSRSSA
ncbi:hypothetical protein BC938DRAFT_482708 [Jimgerdemannia flammicorona]|uniref:Cofilin n=1 Tax=Jimgerdemannia flammicorona TaxID=994334 RepID=A0A433QWA8_9FUNG|nr:hypothetical protein BC938DRAFT_482708 [Jimgerdemannia flammicorona]